jgi:hypothetical protein
MHVRTIIAENWHHVILGLTSFFWNIIYLVMNGFEYCVDKSHRCIISFLNLSRVHLHGFRIFPYWRLHFVYLFVYSRMRNFHLSGGCHHYWWQGCKFRLTVSSEGPTPTSHGGIRTRDIRIIRSSRRREAGAHRWLRALSTIGSYIHLCNWLT